MSKGKKQIIVGAALVVIYALFHRLPGALSEYYVVAEPDYRQYAIHIRYLLHFWEEAAPIIVYFTNDILLYTAPIYTGILYGLSYMTSFGIAFEMLGFLFSLLPAFVILFNEQGKQKWVLSIVVLGVTYHGDYGTTSLTGNPRSLNYTVLLLFYYLSLNKTTRNIIIYSVLTLLSSMVYAPVAIIGVTFSWLVAITDHYNGNRIYLFPLLPTISFAGGVMPGIYHYLTKSSWQFNHGLTGYKYRIHDIRSFFETFIFSNDWGAYTWGVMFNSGPGNIVAIFIAFLLLLSVLIVRKKNLSIPRNIALLCGAGFILWAAAHVFSPMLNKAYRYTTYVTVIFLCVVAANNIDTLLTEPVNKKRGSEIWFFIVALLLLGKVSLFFYYDTTTVSDTLLFTFIGTSLFILVWISYCYYNPSLYQGAIVFAILFVLFAFYPHMSIHVESTVHTDGAVPYELYDKLFLYAEHNIDPSATIAAPAGLTSGIAAFSKQKVYYSGVKVHFGKTAKNEFNDFNIKRYRKFEKAYYARQSGDIKRFIQETGVQYIVVDRGEYLDAQHNYVLDRQFTNYRFKLGASVYVLSVDDIQCELFNKNCQQIKENGAAKTANYSQYNSYYRLFSPYYAGHAAFPAVFLILLLAFFIKTNTRTRYILLAFLASGVIMFVHMYKPTDVSFYNVGADSKKWVNNSCKKTIFLLNNKQYRNSDGLRQLLLQVHSDRIKRINKAKYRANKTNQLNNCLILEPWHMPENEWSYKGVTIKTGIPPMQNSYLLL